MLDVVNKKSWQLGELPELKRKLETVEHCSLDLSLEPDLSEVYQYSVYMWSRETKLPRVSQTSHRGRHGSQYASISVQLLGDMEDQHASRTLGISVWLSAQVLIPAKYVKNKALYWPLAPGAMHSLCLPTRPRRLCWVTVNWRAACHDLCNLDWLRTLETALYHNYAMLCFESQSHQIYVTVITSLTCLNVVSTSFYKAAACWVD
jgi:hypothetical protein